MATEFIAGVTTFLTMSYIVVVNPSILSTVGTGMPFSGVLTATVVLSATMTLLMGLYARLPFAVAPGMGINAFFTYTVVLQQGVPWPTALGAVFWAGVFFMVISVTPARMAIAQAIPHGLRLAAAAGIGLFISFIGLKNAGLVVAGPEATLVKLGQIDARVMLSLYGLLLIVVLLRVVPTIAYLGGIVGVTAIAVYHGHVQVPASFFSQPDFGSVFLKLDIWGAAKLALVPTILAIALTDLFDSISTFVGVSQASGLLDEKGEPKNLREGLIVDALATLGAGLMGTSSGTAYIESVAGIEMGGRTGWTSLFTALCFLPCLFLAPLVGMVPPMATAPVLILVGAMMFKTTAELPMQKMEDIVPQYLTILLIPLTFSITQGILWGFLFHVILYSLAGRSREIRPTMWFIAVLSAVLLIIENRH